MNKSKPLITQISASYHNQLKIINGVKFTPREIDVIAGLLSGKGSKTIARFLSIEEKTVETHKYNVMRKLECNTKEGIIHFVEKSDKFSALKNHYITLLREAIFEKYLNQISTHCRNIGQNCIVVYAKDENKSTFINQLVKDLGLAGIKAYPEEKVNLKPLSILNNQEAPSIIYLASGTFIEKLNLGDSQAKLEVAALTNNLDQGQRKILFLYEGSETPLDIPQEIQEAGYVDCGLQKDYYFVVFEILQALLPNYNAEKIILEFKEQYKTISDSYDYSHLDQKFADNHDFNYSKLNNAGENEVGYTLNSHRKTSIKSDLIIPTETTFLHRPTVMSQIGNVLSGNEDIQTVALVGIGGAGKTTMARRYARNQDGSVVWEINSETQENLMSSFENLAYALSQTEDEKRVLRGLQEISNLKDKEDKVILFVKDKLRSEDKWFLIYDNVGKFSDIQKYFPFNVETWGKGKVIITTRDSTIQHNNHVKAAITVAELDTNDKFTLFNNIIDRDGASQLDDNNKEQITSLLSFIPPFPLDVSIAAYYLKTTNLPYKNYIAHLGEYNIDLDNIQQDIIKEATQYEKTRYSIVTLSLQCFLNYNKEFEDLLLLISLIDSQQIPKDLLSSYKGEVAVDSFIYHLRKYSLTVCSPSDSFHPVPSLTVHRSTQEISLSYLATNLNLKNNLTPIKSIAEVLEKYASKIFDIVDFTMIKNLKSHCEIFLSHSNLLTKDIQTSIEGVLGAIHYNLGNYIHAKSILEECLPKLDKTEIHDRARCAKVMVYLGMVYRKLGEYEKAKDAIEQSLLIYEKDFPDNHLEFVWALGNLGLIYRHLGNYEKAKSFFEDSLVVYKKYFDGCYIGNAWALVNLGNIYRNLGDYKRAQDLLKQGIEIYKKNLPENHTEIAWAFVQLGDIYRSLGMYDEAASLLKQSLLMYEEQFGKDHIEVAWVLAYLGKIYREAAYHEKAMKLLMPDEFLHPSSPKEDLPEGALCLQILGSSPIDPSQYDKTKELLEECLITFEKQFGKNHISTARIIVYLAEFHKDSGSLEKAEQLLNQTLKIYTDNFGIDHIKTARALRALGEVYFMQGYMETAEDYIHRALMIFEKHNHPESFKALECLAGISLEKLTVEKNVREAQIYRKEAIDYQQKALAIANAYFLANSPHTIRIQTKLKSIENT
ncbi:MAG: tetratricopeptide repeat protein [Alphaproteobacteria bacterium]|jgi:tetratricopeptide (TPR) repeat protein/DNA-binding CsgD family transcriptional regulator|nr:tetratricopeptide repeat protein [Alphaproteobacteria bacterium]